MFEEFEEEKFNIYTNKKDFLFLILMELIVLICGIIEIISLSTTYMAIGLLVVMLAVWLLYISLKDFMQAPKKLISISQDGFETEEYGFVNWNDVEKFDILNRGFSALVWFKYKNNIKREVQFLSNTTNGYNYLMQINVKHAKMIYQKMLYFKSKFDKNNLCDKNLESE